MVGGIRLPPRGSIVEWKETTVATSENDAGYEAERTS
jgi:hypothetical protein